MPPSKPTKPRKIKRPIGKSANPDFTKATLYLSNELHLKMKIHAVSHQENMSDLVERVMADYFNTLQD